MSQFKMYIESCNGIPTDDWGFAAYLGAQRRQLSVVFYEDIDEVPVSKYNIVVGSIENTEKYFNKLGIDIPQALNIPYCLRDYTGRYVLYTTMKGVREGTSFPFFVKPKRLKKFIPGVVNNEKDLGYYFKDIPDDEEVMISGKVEFVSEYRVFVYEDKILGVKHYVGDNLVFPDGKMIQKMVDTYNDPILGRISPIGYSLDVGITNTGETLLVECNDGWSLGNYGLDGISYTNLLIGRWRELTKNCLK